MPGNHGMSLICVFRWQVQRHSGLKCRSTPGSGSSVTAGFGFVTIWTLLLLPMSPKSGSPLLTDFAFPYIPTNSLSVYLFSIKPTNWPLKEAWIFSPLTSTTKFLGFFFHKTSFLIWLPLQFPPNTLLTSHLANFPLGSPLRVHTSSPNHIFQGEFPPPIIFIVYRRH